MPRRGSILRSGTAAAAAVALTLAAGALAGCGGSGSEQDADLKEATYTVSVPKASFPARQQLADDVTMRIVVRNDSDETIPDVSATVGAAGEGTQVDAFGARTDDAKVASRSRPVWIVDSGPTSGDTAYANTWSLGSVAPGARKAFVWHASAIRPGRYRVTWRLGGSLGGKARVAFARGGVPKGTFDVEVSSKPGRIRVTDDGSLERIPPRG